jgi:hypothetical protein
VHRYGLPYQDGDVGERAGVGAEDGVQRDGGVGQQEVAARTRGGHQPGHSKAGSTQRAGGNNSSTLTHCLRVLHPPQQRCEDEAMDGVCVDLLKRKECKAKRRSPIQSLLIAPNTVFCMQGNRRNEATRLRSWAHVFFSPSAAPHLFPRSTSCTNRASLGGENNPLCIPARTSANSSNRRTSGRHFSAWLQESNRAQSRTAFRVPQQWTRRIHKNILYGKGHFNLQQSRSSELPGIQPIVKHVWAMR